jgi:hypothetical protein
MTKPKHQGSPKPYTGPPKPIPTYREPISDRAERVIFLLFAIFMAVFLYLEG